MIRTQVVFAGLPGLPGVSTWHFDGVDPDDVAAAREQLFDFYSGLGSTFTGDLSVSSTGEFQTIEEATGEILAFDFATPWAVDATGAGEPVAAATQGLVRLVTDGVVAGRRVQGRTNLPGLDKAVLIDGRMSSASVAGIQGVANGAFDLEAVTGRLGVYSRPTDTRAGSFHPVTSIQVQQSLAVLRSRRD